MPSGFILIAEMKAIQIHQTGGPEVLTVSDLPIPSPGPGEVLIRVEAIGVNFIDIYFRKGQYKASLPWIPGSEASGTIEELGPGVTGFSAGDLIASTSVLGSYAEYALVSAAQIVKVPDSLSPEKAAAAMLQGMTAHYLSHSTFPLKAGDTALVHAGAGGVGLLLTQIAARIGARVITTVSTAEKAELSREAGASEVILYTDQDFEVEVKRLTGGKGVDLALEAVGRNETVAGAIDCTRKGGTVTLIGNIMPEVTLPLQKVVVKQLRLQGSCASSGEYPEAIELIANGKIKVKPLITAVATLEEGPRWFERLHSREPNLMKVILTPRAQ